MTPAVAVADMAEENRPKGTHEVGDGEAAERDEKRVSAAAVEHPRQHRREIKVEREIVPFDDRRESGDRKRCARDSVGGLAGARAHPRRISRLAAAG